MGALFLPVGELMRRMDIKIGTCAYGKCGEPVRDSQRHLVVSNRVYHECCYFDALGDEVELHPIHNPSRRGFGGTCLDSSDLGGCE